VRALNEVPTRTRREVLTIVVSMYTLDAIKPYYAHPTLWSNEMPLTRNRVKWRVRR
jgi:hypothetical protein